MVGLFNNHIVFFSVSKDKSKIPLRFTHGKPLELSSEQLRDHSESG